MHAESASASVACWTSHQLHFARAHARAFDARARARTTRARTCHPHARGRAAVLFCPRCQGIYEGSGQARIRDHRR